MRRGEKNDYPSPSKGHQTLKPSIGHQKFKPSIGHQVRVFLHFLLLLIKGTNLNNFGLSFLDIIFNLNLEKIDFYNFPWGEKND